MCTDVFVRRPSIVWLFVTYCFIYCFQLASAPEGDSTLHKFSTTTQPTPQAVPPAYTTPQVPNIHASGSINPTPEQVHCYSHKHTETEQLVQILCIHPIVTCSLSPTFSGFFFGAMQVKMALCAPFQTDQTMIKHLKVWIHCKHAWCDNAPSHGSQTHVYFVIVKAASYIYPLEWQKLDGLTTVYSNYYI